MTGWQSPTASDDVWRVACADAYESQYSAAAKQEAADEKRGWTELRYSADQLREAFEAGWETAEAGKAQAEGPSLATLRDFVAFLDGEHAKLAASPVQSANSIGYQNGLYVASHNLKALLPSPPEEGGKL